MKRIQRISALTLLFVALHFNCEGQNNQEEDQFRRCFVGSSAFMLANLLPASESPSFYQLNLGYWLSKRMTVSLEAITWTYDYPLGIPYPDLDQASDQQYPGFVRGYGLGVAFQYFFWKGLYGSVHLLPLRQRYKDEQDELIGKGFMLFTTSRLGYHIPLYKNRFFIEPSIALTYWPVNTNVPDSFQALDDSWNNYFLFEPGFHVGYKF